VILLCVVRTLSLKRTIHHYHAVVLTYLTCNEIHAVKPCVLCRYIAVCLREQRSTGCSVQVWSMREEGCALGTLVLTAKGTLKSSNAGPAAMQQLLAVSSAGCVPQPVLNLEFGSIVAVVISYNPAGVSCSHTSL